ncbi:MAG: phosphoribosyl-ATP diphosphatase [Spirochaetia bacterium]|nr:phosphoribosyl-ATP diphosphatase [Spirochaetia bacterium]
MNTLLLIENEQGGLLSAAIMNAKGFSKSRENGHLWTTDLSTGRLLPLGNETVPFVTLSEEKSCIGKRYYKAVISSEFINRLSTICEKEEAEEQDANARKTGENTLNIEDLTQNSDENIPSDDKDRFPVEFLRSLAQVIHRRHAEMPEGSYTTHLFQKGESKIRKKVGEEAVELVLALTPQDVIYEAADLIYHMMVMLENNGLSLGDVLRELKGRE